jgi:nicotinate-nucleotide adenylyltransferase
MGADALLELHRWRGWVELMGEIPIAVVSRPGASIRSRFAPAARRFAHARRPPGRGLALAEPPAWSFLEAPWSFASSTALRRGEGPD